MTADSMKWLREQAANGHGWSNSRKWKFEAAADEIELLRTQLKALFDAVTDVGEHDESQFEGECPLCVAMQAVRDSNSVVR